MISLGIDVVILTVFGLLFMLFSIFAGYYLRLTRMQCNVAVISTALTSFGMIIVYIWMARILDNMIGIYGW
jgi:hypothetical protein